MEEQILDLKPCFPVLVNIISVFIWVIGVLGNVVNLTVFGQKEMNRSPVNLIFWWLSLSDLFELLTIFFYEYSCKWCLMFDATCINFNNDQAFKRNSFSYLLFWGSNYLLLAFHTTTVLLNITLAILRFMVVRKPIENRSSFSRQSIQRRVISLNVFSFVLSLTILYRATISGNEQTFMGIQHKYFWLLSFEMFVRLGSLAVLVVIGAMFIFAVIRARKDRERDLNSDQTTRETGRPMKQINTLTIIIISMFIISDIAMVVDNVSLWRCFIYVNSFVSEPDVKDVIPFINYMNAYFSFTNELMCYEFIALLVNCSYSIFCYIIFSSQYRKTLRLYLNNKLTWVFGKLKRKNLEDIELPTRCVNTDGKL